jgi:heme exporter protein B
MEKAWIAVLRKEALSELRLRSSLITAILFAVFSVVCISFATYDLQISPQLGSGLLSLSMLFAAVISLPRVMLVEVESKTIDLLRLMGKPGDVFWGKAIYNLVFMAFTSVVLTVLFLGFTHVGVGNYALLAICMAGSSAAFAGTVTLCGALVTHASNQTALAGILSVPLLLPLSFLAVSGLRVALDVQGAFNAGNGIIAGLGLLSYGLATLAVGPYLFAAVWKP